MYYIYIIFNKSPSNITNDETFKTSLTFTFNRYLAKYFILHIRQVNLKDTCGYLNWPRNIGMRFYKFQQVRNEEE